MYERDAAFGETLKGKTRPAAHNPDNRAWLYYPGVSVRTTRVAGRKRRGPDANTTGATRQNVGSLNEAIGPPVEGRPP